MEAVKGFHVDATRKTLMVGWGKLFGFRLGLRRFRVERNSWHAVWLGGGLSVQIQV